MRSTYERNEAKVFQSISAETILVLVQQLKVMDPFFVQNTINTFRLQLINLLLAPDLFDNVHLLIQNLLDLQEEFNEFVRSIEVQAMNGRSWCLSQSSKCAAGRSFPSFLSSD